MAASLFPILLAMLLVSCDSKRESSSKHAPDASTATESDSNEDPHEASLQYQLGMRLLKGDGSKQNKSVGIEWIKKSANQGYENAELELGMRYWKGSGVSQNFQLGSEWLKKASEKENPVAMMILAEAYYRGDEIPKNDEEAVRLCKELVGAFPSFGSILGEYYETGTTVPLDYAEAVRLYRAAAVYGDIDGQMKLAYCYVDGKGVEQSDSEAVKWFRKAAEKGNTIAQVCLGIAYSTGKGVTEDMAEAARWRELAANAGDVDCQLRIGAHYATGDGVLMDNVLAYKWFNLAAASGDERAKKQRDSISEEMTTAEIAEAQKMSREWKPKKEAAEFVPVEEVTDPALLEQLNALEETPAAGKQRDIFDDLQLPAPYPPPQVE